MIIYLEHEKNWFTEIGRIVVVVGIIMLINRIIVHDILSNF